MAREDLHFRLRIPEDLKARIEVEAKRNKRSMTAEIISKLERYESLSGEIDTITNVALALAAAIDVFSDRYVSTAALSDIINEAFETGDVAGQVDLKNLANRYSEEATERLSAAFQGAIRVPPGLKARIHRKAKENRRSVDAEAISTLEREYPKAAEDTINLDAIRDALDLYESEFDPKTRADLLIFIESQLKSDEIINAKWDREPDE